MGIRLLVNGTGRHGLRSRPQSTGGFLYRHGMVCGRDIDSKEAFGADVDLYHSTR